MDYWKDVPGIDGKKCKKVLEKSGEGKTYMKRDVLKQMIKSGKWEVDSGDVDGKTGSSLIMRSHTGKRRACIIEANIAGVEKNPLDDQRFVKAILNALEGADPKIIAKVFTAFGKGDNKTAGKLIANIKKAD